MNGRIAKKIRRIIYGDHSPRVENRRYGMMPRKTHKTPGGVTRTSPVTGMIISDELRRRFQAAKRAYMKHGQIVFQEVANV